MKMNKDNSKVIYQLAHIFVKCKGGQKWEEEYDTATNVILQVYNILWDSQYNKKIVEDENK